MAYYYKTNQSAADQAALITLLRGFFTHASLGWTESAYTVGSSTQLLLKTKDTQLANYGYLHLISNVAGATKYLEVHAYPPDHAAISSPNSFDVPDPLYLPGGGSYSVANEYYSDAGTLSRIDFTFPANVDLFGDGDSGIIYIAGGTQKLAWFGLILTRILGHGWTQFVSGLSTTHAIKNGANVRKGSTYMRFLSPVEGYIWGDLSVSFTGFVQDVTPSKWLMQGYSVDAEVNYREIMLLPNLFYVQEDAARGDEITNAGVTYYVVFPGSEPSMNLGMAVVKGTAIP